MKNHFFCVLAFWPGLELVLGEDPHIEERRWFCWRELHKNKITGEISWEDCKTNAARRGHEDCIDLSNCKTEKEARAALERYYDAINADPHKVPGDLV